MTTQIDALLGGVRKYVAAQHAEITENWDLDFHVHGNRQTTPENSSELFIVAESLAPTQQLATSIASKARIAMIVSSVSHTFVSSAVADLNTARPVSGPEGNVRKFCIRHWWVDGD